MSKTTKYLTVNSLIQDAVETGIKLSVNDYDDEAKVWHNVFYTNIPNKEKLPKVQGEVRVLELGCNTGYDTKLLAEIYDDAVGIDSNTRLIKHSQYVYDKCMVMDATYLEFGDEQFSMVVAKDVIEHLPKPLQTLRDTYRVLADGGYFYALIPLDGEPQGFDDVIVHPSFNFGNESHLWKATLSGVMRRMFDVGFTDVEFRIFNHSQLFGKERPFGDAVALVCGVKKKDVIKVPAHYLLGNNYWAAFLTFKCTGNCSYCIQHVCKDEFMKARVEYEKNLLSGEEWVEYLNRLQRWNNMRLGLIGGEPTLHPDFFDIVNNVKGYYKTITTNLTSDNILKFGTEIQSRDNLRINTSFHPKLISVDEFADKIHLLRGQGFFIDQIAMVDTPSTNFGGYHQKFLKRGIHITPQTFLGECEGEWYPNPDSTAAKDYGETGINDRAKYEAGFQCKQKQQALCYSTRFLMAPDGGIYRCHYQLYSGRDKQGGIRERTFPIDQDYRLCNDFGFCNPCDFPHVQFKGVTIPIEQIAHIIARGKPDLVDMCAALLADCSQKDQDHQKLFNTLFNVLYASIDPMWELYNNKELKKVVNEFVNKGGLEMNKHLELLCAYMNSIPKALNMPVNIYRIFDDMALAKYLSYEGVYQSKLLTQSFKEVEEFFPMEPELLMPVISKIMSTFGTMQPYRHIYMSVHDEGEKDA